MTDVVYNRGKLRIMTGLTVLSGANLRAILAAHPTAGLGVGWDDPDLDTVADLDAVVDVTLLIGDRFQIQTPVVIQDDVNDRANADCENMSFAAAAGEVARAIFIYDDAAAIDDTGRFLIYGSNTNFPQPLDGGLTVQVNDWLRGV